MQQLLRQYLQLQWLSALILFTATNFICLIFHRFSQYRPLQTSIGMCIQESDSTH